MARLVEEAEADIRRFAIPPDLTALRTDLAERVSALCLTQIAPRFPFAPSDQSVALEDFAAFFGPNGAMDRLFNRHLRPHVTLEGGRLVPHPDSPLRDDLRPEFLAQFDHAARIRAAFFPSGPDPRVDLIVSHVDSSPDVAAARLVIDDMLIETVKGDVPVLVQWPGPGTGVSLTLLPEQDGAVSGFEISGSVWDVMRAVQRAASRSVQGDRIRAGFLLGARQITYEIRSRRAPHPLALRDFAQFSCPLGFE